MTEGKDARRVWEEIECTKEVWRKVETPMVKDGVKLELGCRAAQGGIPES